MVFNPDCVRDILTACEQATEELYIEEGNVPEDLVGYSWEELLYHLNQCKASDLFADRSGEDVVGGFTVSTLSPKGHELLSEMRSDNILKKLPKVGIHSLPDLISVIKSLIGLF